MDRYFNWLCGLVNAPKYYSRLLYILYTTEFVWIIRNDENRAADGLMLRDIYNEKYGFLSWSNQYVNGIKMDANLDRGCSILEMLIALSKRIDGDIMYDPKVGEQIDFWFWLMIKNLGLDEFVDDIFDATTTDKIIEILSHFLYRNFEKSGKSGIFPLKFVKKDQRKVEIWYQMQEYLKENFE